MTSKDARSKSRHVYRSGAAGCGGKPAPTNAKNTGQPLPCPFCDRIFKQDGRLKDHLKSKHADMDVPSEELSSSAAVSEPPQQQQLYKSPKTLLHEWCQKNKRPAPKFMHVQAEGGFQCRVILPDPKKNEMDVIRWFRDVMPSSQEAQHRAAVLALHHVMGNRRLDRILADEYRQQWYDLDLAAAEREAKLKLQAQRPKKTTFAPRELQSVYMSEDNRRMVEGILTDTASSVSREQTSEEQAQMSSSLLGMGFREDDVQAALEQANDITTALDWLMLNVDESELPSKFAPHASASAVRVVQRAESIHDDAAGELTEYGYPYEDCVAALKDTGNIELAFRKLFYDAYQPQRRDASDVPLEDLAGMREDEQVALSAIYPGAVISEGFMIFDVEKSLTMEIRVSGDSLYPYELPVIGFRGNSLNAVNFLQNVTQVVAKRGLELLGMPMIYDLVCYAAEAYTHEVGGARARDVASKVEVAKQDEVAPAALESAGKRKEARILRNDQDLDRDNRRLKEKWETLQSSSQYADISAARRKLPAFMKRTELLSLIRRTPVTIICGETGCGKSTQVPQYVLEEAIEAGKGGSCNVVCTQPRRIAALGLATRVATERGETVGGLVGYSVRLDSCLSKNTRLLYCTTGILLRRLLSDPELHGVTHIIVDEVHERSVEIDLLLLLLKTLLTKSTSRIRVVLMSATADEDVFAKYFEDSLSIRIPGFTFPVRELYLEDVLELTEYKITRNSFHAKKKIQKDTGTDDSSKDTLGTVQDSWETDAPFEYSEATRRSLELVDESIINYDLIEKALCTIYALEREPSQVYGPLTSQQDARNLRAGSVLVFLPGMMEIKKLQTKLQTSQRLSTYGVESRWILPLHGSLSGDEQKRVFLRPPPGVRKVVLATNVAETSITIDDIVYVIDTGRHKEMSFDHVKGLSSLQETWISKASSKQRAGRAGRVQPGCCLRLFSKNQFKAFEGHQLPEIQRVSLEGLCLKVKSLLEWNVEDALFQMPTPPDRQAVAAALESLETISAFDTENNELTPLGRHLAQMPVDARVGKMLIFGCMLKCLDPVLTIAAAMSGRPVFVSPPDSREEARLAKLRLSGTSKSDHLTLVAAHNGWLAARQNGWNAEKEYCSSNFVSREAMVGIEASRQDYLNVLRDIGFLTGKEDEESLNLSSSSGRVIKAVVCAGFYPNVARIRHPETTYVQTEGGTVRKLAAAHEIHYFTKSDGRVFLHPASVNFSAGHFESSWLVITEKMKTSKVYVRECSMVPAYSLLIFGGSISVLHEKKMIVLDGWVEFEAPGRIAVLIKELRKKIDVLLQEKTRCPELSISMSPVVSTLLKHATSLQNLRQTFTGTNNLAGLSCPFSLLLGLTGGFQYHPISPSCYRRPHCSSCTAESYLNLFSASSRTNPESQSTCSSMAATRWKEQEKILRSVQQKSIHSLGSCSTVQNYTLML